MQTLFLMVTFQIGIHAVVKKGPKTIDLISWWLTTHYYVIRALDQEKLYKVSAEDFVLLKCHSQRIQKALGLNFVLHFDVGIYEILSMTLTKKLQVSFKAIMR